MKKLDPSSHRVFSIVLSVYILIAITYSMTTPLFEAPDEQWHFAFIQYVSQTLQLPIQGQGQVAHLARQEGSQPPLYYSLAALGTFWVDTFDFPGIAWENPHYGFNVPGTVNDNKNLFIHTSQESFPWHNTALAVHLSRILSILFGIAAVSFAYLLALEIFRGDNKLAAASAAFLAFIPQFIFVSAAVSNDSSIVALCAMSMWLMARELTKYEGRNSSSSHVFTPAREWSIGVLGLVSGFAALAKVSGLSIIVVAALVVFYLSRRDFRLLVLRLFLLLFPFGVVAGWWYVRNILLYGEFTGTDMMLSIFGARVTPLAPALFFAQMNEVWETFWVGFGWGNVRAPSLVYMAYGLFVAISAAGWVRFIVSDLPFIQVRGAGPKILLLLAWIVVIFAAFLRWMLITQAPHGRLLFPALPALAPLVVSGWVRVMNRSPRPQILFAPSLPFAFFLLPLFALFFVLRPAYAFPPALSESEAANSSNRVDVTYDEKLKLLRYDLSAVRVLPDSAISIKLDWQSLAPMTEDFSVGISLLDSSQAVLSQRSSYPGHGMLPTSLWYPGQMIRDGYWLPIPGNTPAPSIAQIQVTLFRRATQVALPASDPTGHSITPIISRIKVASQHPVVAHAQNSTNYSFGNQLELIGYDVNSAGITLYWKRLAPIQVDYTVFVHGLDKDGAIIAQKDAEPNIPSSLWDDGEIVIDRHLFGVSGVNRFRIGLYRADTGERLRVGNDDNVILGAGQ